MNAENSGVKYEVCEPQPGFTDPVVEAMRHVLDMPTDTRVGGIIDDERPTCRYALVGMG